MKIWSTLTSKSIKIHQSYIYTTTMDHTIFIWYHINYDNYSQSNLSSPRTLLVPKVYFSRDIFPSLFNLALSSIWLFNGGASQFLLSHLIHQHLLHFSKNLVPYHTRNVSFWLWLSPKKHSFLEQQERLKLWFNMQPNLLSFPLWSLRLPQSV